MKSNAPYRSGNGYRQPNNYRTPPRRKSPNTGAWLLAAIFAVLLGVFLIWFTKPHWDGSGSGTPTPPPTSPTTVTSDTPTPDPSYPDATDPPQPTDPTAAPTDNAAPTPADPATRDAARSTLESAIQTLLGGRIGRYGVYYYNLGNGESIGISDSSPFVAASSVKIAYNTYLYKASIAGQFPLTDQLAYNSAAYPQGDFEAGTGDIQNKPNGTQYSLSELSRLSICISDNCATNMILRKLGGIEVVNDQFMKPISSVVDYRGKVDYTDFRGTAQSGKNRTSARDLSMYAKSLYELYQSDKGAYQPLIDNLSQSIFTWGLQNVSLPTDVNFAPPTPVVAHKIGFNTGYFTNNDVGIVFAAEDYVLCVMTENTSDADAQKAIAEVSQLVYEYILDVSGYR